MNPGERLAYVYLRLNGFLLLPHFTVFGHDRGQHVDLIGLRAPNSVESVDGFEFPTDDLLFDEIAKLVPNPRGCYLGVVCEVRTSDDEKLPSDEHAEYVSHFLGGTPVVKVSVCDYKSDIGLVMEDGVVRVPIRKIVPWFAKRVKAINDAVDGMSKSGSWTWSSDELAELLQWQKWGIIRTE